MRKLNACNMNQIGIDLTKKLIKFVENVEGVHSANFNYQLFCRCFILPSEFTTFTTVWTSGKIIGILGSKQGPAEFGKWFISFWTKLLDKILRIDKNDALKWYIYSIKCYYAVQVR